jgi:hypothetical protein
MISSRTWSCRIPDVWSRLAVHRRAEPTVSFNWTRRKVAQRMPTVRMTVTMTAFVIVVGCGSKSEQLAAASPPQGPSADLRVAVVGASGMTCSETRTTIKGLSGQTDLVRAQREDELQFQRFSAGRNGGTLHEGVGCDEVVRRPATAHCYPVQENPRSDLPVGISMAVTLRAVHLYSADPVDIADAMNGCVGAGGRWERVE